MITGSTKESAEELTKVTASKSNIHQQSRSEEQTASEKTSSKSNTHQRTPNENNAHRLEQVSYETQKASPKTKEAVNTRSSFIVDETVVTLFLNK